MAPGTAAPYRRPVSSEPTVHLHLEVGRRGGTLVGEVGVEGEPAMRFTGWTALNAAIDALLEAETQRRGADAGAPVD